MRPLIDSHRSLPRAMRPATRDILIIAVAVVIVGTLAIVSDLMDGLARWTERHGLGSLPELSAVLVVLVIGLALFSWRRVGELRREIETRTQLERELLRRAAHNPLSQLPNRSYFAERLNAALATAGASGSRVATLFLDLDDLRWINDHFGQAVGDVAVIIIGQRLRSCLRTSDTVARFDGDEFAVLLENVEDAAQVELVAGRIVTAFQTPITIGPHTVPILPSIGFALSSSELDNAEALMSAADVAIYYAKHGGEQRVSQYRPEMKLTGLSVDPQPGWDSVDLKPQTAG